MMYRQQAGSVYRSVGSNDVKRLRKVMVMYEAALNACVTRDIARFEEALDALEATLDFAAWPELAMSLSALYHRCRQEGGAGLFREAGATLATLRKAWLSGGHFAQKAG
ncbi:MAG: hypothetical protein WC360_07965 [Opitutales bacterium]|jgi:flagellin-specific chaperone FliS